MRISDWIRRVLFRSGVTRVINLCPPDEPCAYDEEGLMAELGLDYLNIPVAGGADLSEDNARKLAIALEAIAGTALVHCASSNRSEEHTSELQSLMRMSYAVFCLKKNNRTALQQTTRTTTSSRLHTT